MLLLLLLLRLGLRLDVLDVHRLRLGLRLGLLDVHRRRLGALDVVTTLGAVAENVDTVIVEELSVAESVNDVLAVVLTLGVTTACRATEDVDTVTVQQLGMAEHVEGVTGVVALSLLRLSVGHTRGLGGRLELSGLRTADLGRLNAVNLGGLGGLGDRRGLGQSGQDSREGSDGELHCSGSC